MKLPPFTVNDKLILEPYKLGQGVQADIRGGLAFVKQKTDLVGLKLLVEARLSDGTYLPPGSICYLQEEILCASTSVWAKQIRKCSALDGQEFIVVDKQNIILIDTNEEFGVSYKDENN